MEKIKIAIIGTSCSGKTTKALEVLYELKKRGILADGLLSQDRRFCFEREKLETEKLAQYYVILEQAKKEAELMLKDDVNVLISDRSVVDFYAYLETMYGRDDMFFNFVKLWAKSYKVMYYLEPLSYVYDGKRPTDEFRLKVDKKLRKIIKEFSNVKVIERDKILADILVTIGKRVLMPDELSEIKDVIKQPVLLGGSYASGKQKSSSDVDIYVLGNKNRVRKDLELLLKRIFGVDFDVTEVEQTVWRRLKRQGFVEI